MKNMKNTKKQGNGSLQQGIRSWQIALIGTGGVVGSCYFLGLGVLIRDMGPAVMFAFIAVALVVYGMMLSYSELLVNFPRQGSFVSYTKEFLGQTASAGIGWAFWFNWVCYVPSEAIGVAVVINSFFPGNEMAYACGVLILLTIINLSVVDVFAKIESSLAILKICVIALFCLLGLGIWIGLWGNNGFLGAAVNFSSGDIFSACFPNGVRVVLTSMVVVLVNFQGIEILGLAAAETQNAETAVPKACKTATFLIMGLYLLPIVVILLIFPTRQSSLDGAIFAQILGYYHLDFWAALISAAVSFAAFSCANTGLYGSARSMYGLATEGLAPKVFMKIDRHGSPKNAVLFTLGAMWLVLLVSCTGSGAAIYEKLLSVSGFTGALAWIGIIASQMIFRERLRRNGYGISCLKAAVPSRQKWMTWYALVGQTICLVMLAFGEGQLSIFLIACGAVLLPMLTVRLLRKRGKWPESETDEKRFDEVFPPQKSGSGE